MPFKKYSISLFLQIPLFQNPFTIFIDQLLNFSTFNSIFLILILFISNLNFIKISFRFLYLFYYLIYYSLTIFSLFTINILFILLFIFLPVITIKYCNFIITFINNIYLFITNTRHIFQNL